MVRLTGQCQLMFTKEGPKHLTDLPVRLMRPLASSATERTSAMPESVALSSLNVASTAFASRRESVVFPHLT